MLTVKEAAHALRRDEQTIRRYLKDGTLVGRKVGKSYLIPEEAVKRLQEPEQEPPDSGSAEA